MTDFDETNFVLMDFYVGIQNTIRFYKEVADFVWAREIAREKQKCKWSLDDIENNLVRWPNIENFGLVLLKIFIFQKLEENFGI